MTVICGYREAETGTWIAGDRLISSANGGVYGFASKWAHGKDVSIGVCGSGAIHPVIADCINEIAPDASLARIWEWLHEKLIAGKWEPKRDPGDAPYYSIGVMFATRRRLVTLCGTGGAIEHPVGYFVSRGSGADVADGAAWVHLKQGTPIAGMMEDCIKAANHYDMNCDGTPEVRKLV